MMKKSLLALVSVIALAACQPSEPVKQDAKTETPVAIAVIKTAEAEFKDGAYALSWSFDGNAAPVTISVTSDPNAETGEILAKDVTETSFTWKPEAGVTERHYFIVKPANGEGELFATRL